MAAIKENQSVTVNLASATQYGYSFTDGFANTHSFVRDLADDCPGVDITFTGGASITFLGSGMGQPGMNIAVTVGNSTGSRTFLVTWTGRIGGITTP